MESKLEGKNEVPEGFICPISHVIMKDPYIDSDGNSYEKSEIMDWLRINPISPITRNPIDATKLVPNRILKSLIEEYMLSGKVALDAKASGKGHHTEPAVLNRKPLILFAVIDNSGSMGESCGTNAAGEDDGYSRLDLVKHTLNTIITSLTPNDKICIIKFSTVAEVFTQLMVCSEQNKKAMMERLHHLEPENQTNIWDGVRVAIDMVNTLNQDARNDRANVDIYLLTDGEPTINPPGPIVDTVRGYLSRKCPTRVPVIHTFGYGYRLDSSMLFNIAKVGNGIFGFIPDSTMVGTVFINALSHSLISDAAHRGGETGGADAKADSKEDAKADAKSGETSEEDELMAQVVRRMVAVLEHSLEDVPATEKRNVLTEFVHYTRMLLEDLLATRSGDAADSAAQHKVKAFLRDLMLDCTDSKDPNLGQIWKAVDENFFGKWGKHYLFSVLSAYQQRVCINFKDKGMQHFKSAQFTAEQGRVEEMFVQLAPPKPSRTQHPYAHHYAHHTGAGGAYPPAAPATVQPVSMTTYYDAGGGCYGGNSLICTLDEKEEIVLMKASEIYKGTKVMTNKGPSHVECVVRLKYKGNLHAVGSTLQLTPYHPVLIKNMTYFPVDFQAPTICATAGVTQEAPVPFEEGYVYDFVLENRGLLGCPLAQFGGGASASSSSSDATSSSSSQPDSSIIFAATFGHDSRTGKFIHPYFGSEVIVNELKAGCADGYAGGHLTLDDYVYVRCDKTNLVQGMKAQKVK